jgi:hypothetical protein
MKCKSKTYQDQDPLQSIEVLQFRWFWEGVAVPAQEIASGEILRGNRRLKTFATRNDGD